jgi:hypothetical protein
MKTLHCAECGAQLHLVRRVYNQKIYNLVVPHTCEEIPEDNQSVEEKLVEAKPVSPPPNVDELFNSFKFVKKLNKLPDKSKVVEPGDRRPKEIVKSTAPKNLLEELKGIEDV